MAERKTITTLSVITDSETSYDNIGDIDGGMFDEEWLLKHVFAHGTSQLIHKLASMSFQIMAADRKVKEKMAENLRVARNISIPTGHTDPK